MNATALVLLLAALAGAEDPVPRIERWTVAPHIAGGGGRVLFAAEPPLIELAGDPDWAPSFAIEVVADEKGTVTHEALANGWAHAVVISDRERTVLVEPRGAAWIYVGGQRLPGDIYNHGFVRWPVRLKKGKTHVLVRAVRGKFTLRLLPAEGPASVGPEDTTVPGLREGHLLDAPGAVVVRNHGTAPLGGCLEGGEGDLFRRVAVRFRPIPPLMNAKPPIAIVQLRPVRPEDLRPDGKTVSFPVRLLVDGREVASHEIVLGPTLGETRFSRIDGSIQLAGVRRPTKPLPRPSLDVFGDRKRSPKPGTGHALFLTLHGAGVGAPGQARAYEPKEDAYVVAPTNRRRFGFDWQDWGMLDALECLEHLLATEPIDPDRVVLTGHSMGGHGAWYVGTLHADRFAAVAPSAGWASFFTYGRGMPRDLGDAEVLDVFERVQGENDTEAFVPNLAATPVYVLHGEKDDNVPVGQARILLGHLAKTHRGYVFHEEPGAGHWWGNRCVDWPPLIEFGLSHRRGPPPARFSFRTPNPGLASRCRWVTIEQQIRPGEISGIDVDVVSEERITIKTENVQRFTVHLPGVVPDREVRVVVDGVRLRLATGRVHRLWRGTDVRRFPSVRWLLDMPPGWKAEKRPGRIGPFKMAWQRGMIWVHGTGGTDEENEATLAKVRSDLASWRYRANGHVTVIPDTDYEPERFPGRNVILFGNATTNAAFRHLRDGVPIRVERGKLTVGTETREGDLGALFVYPGPGETLFGVVAATTPRAMRFTQPNRYFISGAAVPDWVIFDETVLRKGLAGVLDAGHFENDWSLREERR
jgi:dienelactone hydrolase